jgi:hypothetical protein
MAPTDAAPWTVNAGTLLVNGSIASSVLGGVLGGNGTVGDITSHGAAICPARSPMAGMT